MIVAFDDMPMNTKNSFSLCDAVIDKVFCEANSVQFCFSCGFYRIENDELIRTKNAFVKFEKCNADDFTCYIFKRITTTSGAELYGKPYSLQEIRDMLAGEKRKIEIYLELYDFNFMYWRGVLLPYNSDGLSDRIDIEISGQVSVTYFWE